MQFAEETARDEALIRGSYEIRTRLTPMIAYLKLLVDEMVDSPEERDELIRESFHSAANIFTTLEFIENTIKRQALKK